MLIASVLHTFDIHPVIGEDGKQYDPTTEVVTGLISYVNVSSHLYCWRD